MALITTLIENAMAMNAAAVGEAQSVAANRLAQAIVDTVKLSTINYTVGLIAPPGTAGGPVTGSLAAATLT